MRLTTGRTRALRHRALVVRHVAFEDLGILDSVLADHGLKVTYWDAGIDSVQAIAEAGDPDLLVVLGGPIGADDDAAYPFLVAEHELVRTRLLSGRPMLGICLGAQLMARALGGGVSSGDRVEIGWAPVDLTAVGARSVLAPLAGLDVLHWHGDRIILPESVGATVLASMPTTPVQAFAVPGGLALQFHLEADPARIDRWLIGHAHELAANGLDPRVIRADSAARGPRLVDVGRQVVADWLTAVGL